VADVKLDIGCWVGLVPLLGAAFVPGGRGGAGGAGGAFGDTASPSSSANALGVKEGPPHSQF
jgi:hypothetical protein